MNLMKQTDGFFAVALVALGALFATACSKQPAISSDSAANSANSVAANACTSSATVDTNGLAIISTSSTQVGQPVTYQLNKNLDCSTSQNVAWQNTTSFAENLQHSNSKLMATYSQPGTYIVSVTVNTMTDGSVSVAHTSGIRALASTSPTLLSSVQVAQRTTVVGSSPMINAPQVAILGNEVDFSLVVPSGATANNIVWNLADGATSVAGNSGINHLYFGTGVYTISVAYSDENGNAIRLSQPLNIVEQYDNLDCITSAGISSPSQAYVNSPVSISSYTPSCLAPYVQTITWTLGDGASDSGASITHTYANTGSDVITSNVSLNLPDGTSQTLTLTQPIAIVAAPAATPSPTPLATAPPSPSPSPTATPATPTPSPTPVDLNSCSNVGQTKDILGTPYTQQAACGLDGHKTQTYAVDTKYACQMHGGSLGWTQTSQTPILQSEGACQGQSCSLPDGSKLTDGQAQVGVVIGTVQVPVSCQFGEQGITSSYNQIEDKTCSNGALSVGNVRNGSLITAGSCPIYAWSATGTFGACSADCGGTQSMTYSCLNNSGAVSDAARCTGAQPVQSQVCDGNPAAVAHSDVATSDQDANSTTQSCPANQIGVIVNERSVTTTTSYACVNHAVQSTAVVSYGTWVPEPYCRPYTAYRCSQDSLNEQQGLGRYNWMVKCQDQDPIIKEFITDFAAVKASGGFTDQTNGVARNLYPTFMQVVNGVEKAWIAPTVATASCTLPSSAYIAAVCLSGCATPEQQLVTQAKSNAKMKYTTFLNAITNNHPNVGTLADNASIDANKLKSTPVDQWVSDMVDSEHAIRVFHTQSGQSLSVTTNHTLIVPDGSIVIASSLKVGDSLVRVGGQGDEIVSIDDTTYFGKVYNVFVKSSSLQRNIVVTNGFLNGTDFYQNEGVSNLNRVILRKGLVGGILK